MSTFLEFAHRPLQRCVPYTPKNSEPCGSTHVWRYRDLQAAGLSSVYTPESRGRKDQQPHMAADVRSARLCLCANQTGHLFIVLSATRYIRRGWKGRTTRLCCIAFIYKRPHHVSYPWCSNARASPRNSPHTAGSRQRSQRQEATDWRAPSALMAPTYCQRLARPPSHGRSFCYMRNSVQQQCRDVAATFPFGVSYQILNLALCKSLRDRS